MSILGYKVLLLKKSVNKEKLKDISEEIEEIEEIQEVYIIMKKYIGDVTYNMQYKEYSKILTKKVQLARGCKGYKEFLEDVT